MPAAILSGILFAATATMKMAQYERLVWPDVLKIVSVIAVVVIHSAAPLLVDVAPPGPAGWWIGNLYDSAVRWCIPVFVMLSGTFLIDKAYTQGAIRFLGRRFRRLFVPFVVWSTAYLLWRMYINREEMTFTSFPARIAAGPVYYHLWFIYMMFGLYLLAPVLGVYTRYASRRNQLYFLAAWALFASILPTLEPLVGIAVFPPNAPRYAPINFVGYFILGHLLRDTLMPVPKRTLLAVVFFVAFAFTAAGTYYLSVVRNAGVFDGLLYEYHAVNVLAMAIAVYLVAKSTHAPALLQRLERRTGSVRLVAACVPGIYLVHAMVIAVLRRGIAGITLSPTSFHPLIGVPFFALLVFVISFAIIAAIRALPVVRWSVP